MFPLNKVAKGGRKEAEFLFALAFLATVFLATVAPHLPAETVVSGTLSTGEWTQGQSPYHATGTLLLPAGAALTIHAGVEVLFDPEVSLVVDGTLNIAGTAEGKVAFRGSDPHKDWGGLVYRGGSASGTLEHLEFTGASLAKSGKTSYAGAFSLVGGARAELHHCHIFDIDVRTIDSSGGSQLLMFDSLIEDTREGIHSERSYAHVERVTVRNVTGYSDNIDFDYDSDPQSVIRNCLIENNAEDDGIDLASANALVEDVIIRGIGAGKAISMDGKSSPVFNRIQIYDCQRGIVSKDGCTPVFHNVTVTRCELGIDCFEKYTGRGGGHGTGDSMIVWGNETPVQLDELSTFTMTYSDVQGGYPGEGNGNFDPLFVNPLADDFRLHPDSPAIGAGKNGENMGACPVAASPEGSFIRSDANGDGSVDISDALAMLFYQFSGLVAPPCLDALDGDDSGDVDVTDVIHLLSYLFKDGPAPPPPYPEEGTDPTDTDPYHC